MALSQDIYVGLLVCSVTRGTIESAEVIGLTPLPSLGLRISTGSGRSARATLSQELAIDLRLLFITWLIFLLVVFDISIRITECVVAAHCLFR